MDKAAIKTFAINSRRKLMEDVEYRMSLVGITKDGIQDSITDAEGIQTFNIGGATHSIYDEDIKKRENLIKEVNNKGFENVVEEVAYTWFNRIIAIRYMEVNDYLPTRTRVLSSETPGKTEPDIITEAFNIDLDYTDEDKQHIFKLKDKNKLDELFRFLFIKQCNKLNEILPGLFEKTEDYMELLLNISFVSAEGVIRSLIDNISEKDFTNQVEIIGWIYQFYNAELKDETFANVKKKIKISKERIPAATQLFTPDWIVKYMVENSVGRLWLEGHPNEQLKSKWKFFIDDAEQGSEMKLKLAEFRNESAKLNPQDIKVIDPCMGSGHILVYIFDVLMQIYVSEGYTEKDATENILKYNLYGLDIDDRAYQLSYFAVLMNARKYHRNILRKNINPFICSIQESNGISKKFIDLFIKEFPDMNDNLNYLLNLFYDAKEFGSIIEVNEIDLINIQNSFDGFLKNNQFNLEFLSFESDIDLLKSILKQAELLSLKYEVVITNPPYMGKKGINKKLKNYLEKYYSEVKTDLYATFIKRCYHLSKPNYFFSMITIHTWMFITSYEKLRKDLLENNSLINMVHTGANTFEEVNAFNVLATSFVFRNIKLNNYISSFIRLIDYKNYEEKIKNFNNQENLYKTTTDTFELIPSSPFAYWISDKVRMNFLNNFSLNDFSKLRAGIQTGDNEKFIKYWFEIDFTTLGFDFKSSKETINSKFKWFPLNKGGKFRKWYGNNEYVIDWENDGYNIKKSKEDKLKKGLITKNNSECWNQEHYFKKGIVCSLFGFRNFGVRYKDYGYIFDITSFSIFPDEKYLYYILSFLSSNVAFLYLSILAPTVSFTSGIVSSLPLLIDEKVLPQINILANENILLSKEDWDNFEESWDFTEHPFLKYTNNQNLSIIFEKYMEETYKKFQILKNNEEKINKLFIKIYHLENEISFDVDEKDIAMNIADYERDIKSFISYAVGCIFGRYSLNNEGLQFAGGEFDINNYSKFIPDDDNIIPVLDTEYFNDDIVGRFVEFVKTCFGEETLEENLDFIAGALKKRGSTSREIIRNYFLTDFFKDHVQTYKKCPIYWQFDSGKQNGFKCLIYMHRYDPSLVARVRTDYLHKTQKAIEQNIIRCDNIINNTSSASEKSKVTKEKNKLVKQLAETREYDEALAYIANQNIEIDLDDGVKVNYEKFQNVEVSKEGQKSKKIRLLKKI